MKLHTYILIILNFLFLNLIFSQEETTKFYITELRGDISLEMEINNLESNKGPIYIRILDENENPVIVGTSPVINYSSEISFDSISAGKYAIQFFHDENENQKMDFNQIGIINGIEDTYFSSFDFGLYKENIFTKNDSLGLQIYQPLRSEYAQMDLIIPTGRTKNKKILFKELSLDLSPTGRQINSQVTYSAIKLSLIHI